jgi:hypothetical protein
LYFSTGTKTATDLWVLPLDGSREPRVYLNTTASELLGQFSPNGRWVAYQSNETDRFEIYVRSFPIPGAPIPISTAGGMYARWSTRGDELYYIAPDATLTAVPVSIKSGTLEAGKPTPLFRTRRVGGGADVVGSHHQYDVAPDGRFLINVEPESTTPITLLMNWKP